MGNAGCGPCMPGGNGGGKLKINNKNSVLKLQLENNADMLELLNKAKSLVDSAKGYTP